MLNKIIAIDFFASMAQAVVPALREAGTAKVSFCRRGARGGGGNVTNDKFGKYTEKTKMREHQQKPRFDV